VSDLSATRALPCAGTRDQPISLQASSLLRVWRASSPAAREVAAALRPAAPVQVASTAGLLKDNNVEDRCRDSERMMLKPGIDPPLVVGPVHLSFKPIQLVVPPESAGPVLDALRVLQASRHFFRRLFAGWREAYLSERALRRRST
jgi:hypothetical protein